MKTSTVSPVLRLIMAAILFLGSVVFYVIDTDTTNRVDRAENSVFEAAGINNSKQMIIERNFIGAVKRAADPVESAKSEWGHLLASHPFYTREILLDDELHKRPKTDRPDLAYEFEFLRTMDPALGQVPSERMAAAVEYTDQLLKNRSAIANVNWEERGPVNVGGRTRAIMFDPNDATHKKVWAGGVGGGLWYTNDITVANPVWNKVDDFWDNIAIATIAYNPANTSEFFVGTGEGWGNGGAQRGNGIWRTSNGGVSWSQLATTVPGAYNSTSHFHWVHKIVVASNGYVFAATKGYYINRGGILRSTDGGANWSRVLSVYNSSGDPYDWAADIEIAANGDLYCSFGVGSEGKVFKSTSANNGAIGTWTDLSANIVMGNAERIELACAPSNSNVIYAVADGGTGPNGTVEWFKMSTDAGANWSSINIPRSVEDGTTHFSRDQTFYDLILAVHPLRDTVVIAGGIDLHRTLDGGATWSGISHWYGGFSQPEVHADQHSIVFRPGNPDEVIFGHDGGISYSTNAGNVASTPTFTNKNSGYNVTQLYACATKNEVNSHYFLMGSQDNGSHKYTQPQLNSTNRVSGGDGGFCHIDQVNSDIQLTAYIFNDIYRSLDGGVSFSHLFSNASGHFINPSVYDSDRKILYSASNNDLIKRVSGLDGTYTNTDHAISVGASKVSALQLSPYNDVLILGIANGRIYKYSNPSTGSPTLTRIDNGTTPITTAGWVSSIDIGANDNHIIVSYSSYGVVSVWETTDGGTNWYNKEGNLPDIPIRSILFNPDNRNDVLVATELGVWSTNDFQPGTSNAPTWGPTNTGLAHTRCDMLTYRPADKTVVVATHGRGLFTADVFATSSIADFVADNNITCTGSMTVNLTDASLKPEGDWAWDVDNDGNTDYTSRNVTHTYSSPGVYSVKLTVNNGANSITKSHLINVASAEPTASTGCSLPASSNSGNTFGIGIKYVELASISNSTPENDGAYTNYCCDLWTPLELSTSYDLTITTGTTNAEGASAYIDYNNNGIFESGEEVVFFAANTDGSRTASFSTPSSGVSMDVGLRMRVLSRFGSIPSHACDIGSYGQAEDYTVYFASTTVLPVSLLSFNAECRDGQVICSWSTASEQNSASFTVERSADGKDWKAIGTLAGAGNSNQVIQYSLIDEEPASSISYYRLSQRDFDGRTEFFNMLALDCNAIHDIAIYPNPSQGIFTLSGIEGAAHVEVFDTRGALLRTFWLESENAELDLSELSNGLYSVNVSTEVRTFTKTVLINR